MWTVDCTLSKYELHIHLYLYVIKKYEYVIRIIKYLKLLFVFNFIYTVRAPNWSRAPRADEAAPDRWACPTCLLQKACLVFAMSAYKKVIMLPWLFSSRDQLPTLKPYSCVSGNGDQAVGKSEIAVNGYNESN